MPADQPYEGSDTSAITGARIFDGESLVSYDSVTLTGGVIAEVGVAPPPGVEVFEGRGGTLLPGLIDSHVHTSEEGLAQALRFGVTTELDMGGAPRSREDRERQSGDARLADLRSAGVPLIAPCGHPNQLMVGGRDKLFSPECGCIQAAQALPGLVSADDLPEWMEQREREGSDFIKIMAEDGAMFADPGLPVLSEDVFSRGAREAHDRGKLVLAHALTLDATLEVVRAGIDGLAHIFIDRPHTTDVVATLVDAGVFVIPCLVLNQSLIGISGDDLAADPRVSSRLGDEAMQTLRGSLATYPEGDMQTVLATVAALHRARVPLLAGTDSSALGGVVEGASLHRELALLVRAGLPAIDVLRAATSVPARIFGLQDRGRIRPGARADLLLVDGDPLSDISATLSTRAVWRGGVRSTPRTT